MKTLILFCLLAFTSLSQNKYYIVYKNDFTGIEVEDIDATIPTIFFKPSVVKEVSDSLNKLRVSRGLIPSNEYFNTLLKNHDTLFSVFDQYYLNEASSLSNRDSIEVQVIKKNKSEPCECYKSICENILSDSIVYEGKTLKSIILGSNVKTIGVHYYQIYTPNREKIEHISVIIRNRFSLLSREYVIE